MESLPDEALVDQIAKRVHNIMVPLKGHPPHEYEACPNPKPYRDVARTICVEVLSWAQSH